MRKRSVIDSKDIPLKIPVKETIDKHGVMWQRLYATGHAAEGVLNNYSTEGFPVHCGEDWGMGQITAALSQGPHTSVQYSMARAALHKEVESNLRNRFAVKVR